MMFGNQIHPLHWNRSEGWILDRALPLPRGRWTEHIRRCRAARWRNWTNQGERGGGAGSLRFPFAYVLERCGSPSAKSTFNGNENSLNYATAKFMSSAKRSNDRGGCDFISWHVMCEREGGAESPFYNLPMWDELHRD